MNCPTHGQSFGIRINGELRCATCEAPHVEGSGSLKRVGSGPVSGAPGCHIKGWETMPEDTKAAMVEMMWALKRALDNGWEPEPRRSATRVINERESG